jgi:hypothetical protein
MSDRVRRKLANLGAGMLLTAAALVAIGSAAWAEATEAPANVTSANVRRADLRVSLLHAGSTRAEVERALRHPTKATSLGSGGEDAVLFYADQPVWTRVVLTRGRITEVLLDVAYFDPSLLPPRARVVKATMVRNGVTDLLGMPSSVQRWTEAGRALEQMTFAAPGEPEFSVFLADALVVDVRLGHTKPSDIAYLLLPAVIAEAPSRTDLSIGLAPAQASPLLGSLESRTHFVLKGRPVDCDTYRDRQDSGLVSVTFIGGVLTAFKIWPPSAS